MWFDFFTSGSFTKKQALISILPISMKISEGVIFKAILQLGLFTD